MWLTFLQVHGEHKRIEERHRDTYTRVHNLNGNLAHLEELFATTKREMDEKGKNMTDTTPLVKLKAALQDIKVEIKNFDVRIGVLVSRTLFVCCSLMTCRHPWVATDSYRQYSFSFSESYSTSIRC